MYVLLHCKDEYFDVISKLIENEQNNEYASIMIWGHSWEIEKYQLWDKLEDLMRSQCVRDNVVEYKEMFQPKE